jgi:hypothetical protein
MGDCSVQPVVFNHFNLTGVFQRLGHRFGRGEVENSYLFENKWKKVLPAGVGCGGNTHLDIILFTRFFSKAVSVSGLILTNIEHKTQQIQASFLCRHLNRVIEGETGNGHTIGNCRAFGLE